MSQISSLLPLNIIINTVVTREGINILIRRGCFLVQETSDAEPFWGFCAKPKVNWLIFTSGFLSRKTQGRMYRIPSYRTHPSTKGRRASMPDNCLLIKVISQCCYSWVENYSSFSRTRVARSTEPHLAGFFIFICREHKNMSCAFSGTVSPCYLFWHRRPSIAEYKTWSTSCSDWQFFCYSVRWWCQGRVRKKTADEIPAEGNCR